VVVVDPLVDVADDEQVVRPGGRGGAEQAPLRGVQVLRLVDDHVPVGQRDRALAERAGGLVGELRERAPAVRAELDLDLPAGVVIVGEQLKLREESFGEITSKSSQQNGFG